MHADPLKALEERIRATFARLSSLGPLEQETILTDISAADPDVSRAVARLLGLSAPPAFAAGDLISDRFRIVGLLGRGGMGECTRPMMRSCVSMSRSRRCRQRSQATPAPSSA